jgi:hypothetical protein
MKIIDSSFTMQSTHTAETREVSRESLTLWQRGAEPESREIKGTGVGQLRRRAMALLQAPPARPATAPAAPTTQGVADGDEPLDRLQELEVSLLKLLVERFTGRSIEVLTPNDLKSCPTDGEVNQTPAADAAIPAKGEGWGMVYENYQSHYEAEQTRFQAQGVVNTADGREITLDIQLNMSREFFSEASQVIRAGEALKDPLVVNFSGQAAELTQQSYRFDIDADGREDQIRFLRPSSGFLALDHNADGVINDGSELFGALSGDGFADLAGYDSDGNGWIDESDPIFESLRIWSKDAEGRDQLVALGAKQIGAIYLGHITTPFELRDGQNALMGQVRESGMYLQEDGQAGTLQQIDLVV